MEQKKINDLSKQYQQDYDQSKLDYEVAKVFFLQYAILEICNKFFHHSKYCLCNRFIEIYF